MQIEEPTVIRRQRTANFIDTKGLPFTRVVLDWGTVRSGMEDDACEYVHSPHTRPTNWQYSRNYRAITGRSKVDQMSNGDVILHPSDCRSPHDRVDVGYVSV